MDIDSIKAEMQKDIRCDIHGDIYGHESWAEEIFNLRQRLAQATLIIEEARDLQITGGYLGQAEGLLFYCDEFLGK